MRECRDDHGFEDGSWAHADLSGSGVDYMLHWHPVSFRELEGWWKPNSDRVRDSEFDVVVGIDREKPYGEIAKILWRAQDHWHKGYVPKGNLAYETSVNGLDRFFLLPPDGPLTQDEVDEALASILSTYEGD